MPFAESFKDFIATGCFNLTDSELTFEQLNQINSYLHENPTDGSQFHLTNITLIATTPEVQEQVERGAVTARETPNGNLSAKNLDKVNFYRAFSSSRGQFTPFGSGASHAFQQHDPRRLIENKLRRLLTESAWNSIKFNEVITSYDGANLPLSSYFVANLLFDLQEHEKTLSELSIKDAAFNPSAWIALLRNQSVLTSLGFEINITVDESLKELCSVLEKNSQLTELDLGDTDIGVLGYQILNKLLDNNYQIEKITIKEPKNSGLKVLYQELNQRLNEETTSKERFISEQLNQNKIVNLIFNALKVGNRDLFYFLMNESAQNAITDVERTSIAEKKELWAQNRYPGIPTIYMVHPEFINDPSAALKCDLNDYFKEHSSTVGYFLLEKFYDLNDLDTMEFLILSGANLLENPNIGESSLFYKLLEDKKFKHLNKIISQKINQDLSIVIPNAAYLPASLVTKFSNLHQHLGAYFIKLLKRIEQPLVLQFLTGIGFHLPERKKEFVKAFHYVWLAISQGTLGKAVTPTSLQKLQDAISKLQREAKEAARGIFNRSELNDNIFDHGEELIKEIRVCKAVAEALEKIPTPEANNAKLTGDLQIQGAEQAQTIKELTQVTTTLMEENKALKIHIDKQDEKIEKQAEQLSELFEFAKLVKKTMPEKHQREGGPSHFYRLS